MAKVIGPLHSDRVKGSVSGTTFREYRGMAVTTRRPMPVARVNFNLSSVRAIFSYLSKKWGKLDDYTRNLWYLYAVAHPRSNGMGGTFQLDGNQMFMSINHSVIRLLGAVNELTVPPSDIEEGVIDTVTAVPGLASGGITVSFTHLGLVYDTGKCEIQLAGPFSSPGRVAVKTRFRYKAKVAGNTATCEITGCQPDAWYWVRVRYFSTYGEISAWVSDQSKSKA